MKLSLNFSGVAICRMLTIMALGTLGQNSLQAEPPDFNSEDSPLTTLNLQEIENAEPPAQWLTCGRQCQAWLHAAAYTGGIIALQHYRPYSFFLTAGLAAHHYFYLVVPAEKARFAFRTLDFVLKNQNFEKCDEACQKSVKTLDAKINKFERAAWFCHAHGILLVGAALAAPLSRFAHPNDRDLVRDATYAYAAVGGIQNFMTYTFGVSPVVRGSSEAAQNISEMTERAVANLIEKTDDLYYYSLPEGGPIIFASIGAVGTLFGITAFQIAQFLWDYTSESNRRTPSS